MKSSQKNPAAMRNVRNLINIVFSVIFLAAGLAYCKYFPLMTNSYGVVFAVILQFVLMHFFQAVSVRDDFGRPVQTSILTMASLGMFTSAFFGGVLSLQGMVFYLLPLIWISFSLPTGFILLGALLALTPEVAMWLNAAYVESPLLPTPLYDLPETVNWNGVWKLFGLNAAIVLLVPYMFGRLRSNVFTAPILSPATTVPAPTGKQKVVVSGSKSKTGKESADEAADLEKLKRDNESLAKSLETRQLKEAHGVAQDTMEFAGLLDSIVYFMSKNFKAHTALGFLSIDGGRTFVLNAKFSRSTKLKENIVLFPGSGLVGKSSLSPDASFTTGNVASYPDPVEYYNATGEVSSIMISKIVDEDNHKILGMLVVDNKAMQAFSDTDKELLGRFSSIAAKLIANARMSKILGVLADQNRIIFDISKKLAAENYTRGVIGVLVEHLRKAFQADRLVLCDFSAQEAKGRILRVTGTPGALEEGMLFDIDDPNSLYGQVFLQKRDFLSAEADLSGKYRFHAEEEDGPAEFMMAPLLDENGECIAVVGLESLKTGAFQRRSLVLLQILLTNATTAFARARLFQRIEKQATYDGLTKIPNHRSFQDMLSKRLAEADTSQGNVSLLLMDIDHFKNFNDTYGHPLGDRVLRDVAVAIKSAIRDMDYPARYGGEEFVVILNGADPDTALAAAERVRAAIGAIRISHNDEVLSVTVSIGASCYPIDGQHKQQLIDMADKAMYHSKESGRNQSTLYATLPSDQKIS